jgi:hypothetical protein
VSLVKRMPLLERNHEYDAVLAQAEGAVLVSAAWLLLSRPLDAGIAYHLHAIAAWSRFAGQHEAAAIAAGVFTRCHTLLCQ